MTEAKLVMQDGCLDFVCKHCGVAYIEQGEHLEHPATRKANIFTRLVRKPVACQFAGCRFHNPLYGYVLKPVESACDQFACGCRQEK